MRILFIGTGEIGVPTLRALLQSEHEVVGVITQPDKPAGRSQRVQPPPIKQALTRSDGFLAVMGKSTASLLDILQPARIKDPGTIERIRSLQPDVIVVVAYGQILPRDVLTIPTVACLNLHVSLLPRWRGAAPIQAAIAAGDNQTGVTVMYMDEGLDTGDILLQHKIEILPNETGGSLHDRLGEIAPASLLEALQLLAGGKASRTPQNNALATIAPKLKRDDGRIDWNKPAEVIERQIRGFNPWPGAFVRIDNRNLKIFSAAIVDLSGKPGEILPSDKELVIASGDRALSLTEVQPEGKRRMTGSEFLRGRRAS